MEAAEPMGGLRMPDGTGGDEGVPRGQGLERHRYGLHTGRGEGAARTGRGISRPLLFVWSFWNRNAKRPMTAPNNKEIGRKNMVYCSVRSPFEIVLCVQDACARFESKHV